MYERIHAFASMYMTCTKRRTSTSISDIASHYSSGYAFEESSEKRSEERRSKEKRVLNRIPAFRKIRRWNTGPDTCNHPRQTPR